MLQNRIPVKTDKGLQEIERRTYGLPSQLRQILIMINGRSTVAELLKKLVGFGDIESILLQLELDGFIKALDQGAIKQDAAVNSPASTHQAEFNLEKAKGVIRFVLLGAMGPTAERRVNRIEATTTVEELRVELDAIHDILPKILSKREAQQAWHQLEPIMMSITKPLA
jgi:hypothetical protein